MVQFQVCPEDLHQGCQACPEGQHQALQMGLIRPLERGSIKSVQRDSIKSSEGHSTRSVPSGSSRPVGSGSTDCSVQYMAQMPKSRGQSVNELASLSIETGSGSPVTLKLSDSDVSLAQMPTIVHTT